MIRIILAGLAALLATAPLWLPAIGHWLTRPARVHPADVIAIYGGGKDRTIHGIALYQRGLASEVWHTGYPAQRDMILGILQRQQLPPAALQFLPSHSTWEDAQAIVALARQRRVRSMLVVTSWYHSRRALCALKQQLADSGIEVYFDRPPANDGGPDGWWLSSTGRDRVLSELAKFGYYWLRYGMLPWEC